LRWRCAGGIKGGDCGVEGEVGVGDQVAAGDIDAEGQIGGDGAGVVGAVDGEGDGVACLGVAADHAGDGEGLARLVALTTSSAVMWWPA